MPSCIARRGGGVTPNSAHSAAHPAATASTLSDLNPVRWNSKVSAARRTASWDAGVTLAPAASIPRANTTIASQSRFDMRLSPYSSGVSPELDRALMSAPCVSNVVADAKFFPSAAQWSGVNPSFDRWCTSAPSSIKTSGGSA